MSDELFLQARETDTGRTLQILSHVAKLEAANDKLRKALVAWFVRHKRPDGTEPRPVAPDQQYLDGQNRENKNMNTPITSASVKVMRSHDYCHFEVVLGCSHDDNGNPIPLTNGMVDDLRKQAARLADKAVKQYQQSKRAAMRLESKQSDLSWRKQVAEKTPEAERSPEQKADIKAYKDIQFAAQFDYQDDWQDGEDS